jgi:uncharacterized linocin/CFP29 family protein
VTNGRNNLNWAPDQWHRLNRVVHDEAAAIRVARQLLPLFGESSGFVGSIAGHELRQTKGNEPLSLPSNQNLVPAEISVEFTLAPEQFTDEHVATALAGRAAYLTAIAEDLVVLRGKDASAALDSLGPVSVLNNCGEQVGLFQAADPAPLPLPEEQDILGSILAAITKLRQQNHHGPYCAVVSPDLWQRAFKNRQSTMDAPIHEIRPLFREGGFRYSPAAPYGTGIVFSLGGQTLDLAVPVDATVELVKEERSAFLRVVEQVRLRVNQPTAITPLESQPSCYDAARAPAGGKP